MRKIIISILMLLTALSVMGCSKEDNKLKDLTKLTPDNISCIAVIFEDKDGVTNKVELDLEGNTKTSITYGDNKVELEKHEDEFKVTGDFKGFIKDRLITYVKSEIKSKIQSELGVESGDTSKISWLLQIYTKDDDCFTVKGKGKYPEFVEELLNHLEVL